MTVFYCTCLLSGYGVITDIETCYTARIMLISLIPFLVILLAKAFPSVAGKKVIYLIALIITFILLIGYMGSQVTYSFLEHWNTEIFKGDLYRSDLFFNYTADIRSMDSEPEIRIFDEQICQR